MEENSVFFYILLLDADKNDRKAENFQKPQVREICNSKNFFSWTKEKVCGHSLQSLSRSIYWCSCSQLAMEKDVIVENELP